MSVLSEWGPLIGVALGGLFAGGTPIVGEEWRAKRAAKRGLTASIEAAEFDRRRMRWQAEVDGLTRSRDALSGLLSLAAHAVGSPIPEAPLHADVTAVRSAAAAAVTQIFDDEARGLAEDAVLSLAGDLDALRRGQLHPQAFGHSQSIAEDALTAIGAAFRRLYENPL